MLFYQLKPGKEQEAVDFINGNPNFPHNNTVRWTRGFKETIHGYSVIKKVPDEILEEFEIDDQAKEFFMNTYTDGIVDLTSDDFPKIEEET